MTATLMQPILPMAPSLDEVQADVISAIHGHRESGKRSGLVVVPTGGGKTTLSVKYAKERTSGDGSVLICCHTEELLDQWAATLRRYEVPFLVEKAETKAIKDWGRLPMYGEAPTRVVLASKDSMQNGRLRGWPKDAFTDVVFDEAHRSVTDTWLAVRDHFKDAFLLGLTATPERGDGKPLGSLYETSDTQAQGFIYNYGLADAIRNGHLVPPEEHSCDSEIDLRSLKITASEGDFSKEDLEDRVRLVIEPLANAVVAKFKQLGITSAIVFTPGVRSAYAFAAALSQLGFPSRGVHGLAHDRVDLVQGFRKGEFAGLCNSDMLIEGADFPHIQACVVARPTKRKGRYMQMVGRALRTSPGKTKAFIIHPSFIGAEHSLASTVDLFAEGRSDETKGHAKRLVDSGEQRDPQLALEMAEEIERARRAQAAQFDRKKLDITVRERSVSYGWTVRDPVFAPNASGRKAKLQLQRDRDSPPLPIQVGMLRQHGVPEAIIAGLSRQSAREQLAVLGERERQMLATPRQIARLQAERGIGFQDCLRYTARDAAKLLDFGRKAVPAY